MKVYQANVCMVLDNPVRACGFDYSAASVTCCLFNL